MKKLLSIFLTAALAVSMAACSQSPAQDQTSTDGSSKTQYKPMDLEYHTVEMIKERGVLSVATESQYAPFCFKQTDGTIIGLEPEFMAAFAEHLGVTLDLQDMAFDSVVPSVQGGIVDMGMAGLTPDAKRKLSVDFSDFYFVGGQNLVVKADKKSEYTTVESLNEKSIGAQKGSTQQKIAEEQFPNATAKIMTDIPMLVMDLKNNNIDAVLLDKVTATQYVKLNDDLVISDVAIKVDEEENGSSIAIMKGNTSLAQSLNEFIELKTDDGTIMDWYIKYDEISSTLGVE